MRIWEGVFWEESKATSKHLNSTYILQDQRELHALKALYLRERTLNYMHALLRGYQTLCMFNVLRRFGSQCQCTSEAAVNTACP